MADLDAHPAIRIVGGDESSVTVDAQVDALKWISPQTTVGAMPQRKLRDLDPLIARFSNADAHIYLHNQCTLARQALNRQESYFGRLYNRMTGATSPYVTVPSLLLRKLLSECTEAPVDWIDLKANYQMRIDYAKAFAESYRAAFDQQERDRA